MTTKAACVLLFTALVACSSTKESQPVPEPEPVEWPEPEPLAGDRSIESDLETLILETRRERGAKVVQLLIKNASQRDLDFHYAIEWLDRKGEIVSGFNREWTPLKLAGGESRTIEINGPSPAAETWRLHAEDRNEEPAEANESPEKN